MALPGNTVMHMHAVTAHSSVHPSGLNFRLIFMHVHSQLPCNWHSQRDVGVRQAEHHLDDGALGGHVRPRLDAHVGGKLARLRGGSAVWEGRTGKGVVCNTQGGKESRLGKGRGVGDTCSPSSLLPPPLTHCVQCGLQGPGAALRGEAHLHALQGGRGAGHQGFLGPLFRESTDPIQPKDTDTLTPPHTFLR